MAGFGRPLAGALKWNGENVAADCMAHRARLNYIGHADALKPALTARENLAFCTGLSGVEDAIDAALERLRLTALADVAGRFLSAGEKRRLALARFAAVPAPLWLLDEPTVGLDAQATAAFESLLAEHRAGGGLVVLSTHTVVALDDAETLDMTGYAIARAVFDQDAGR